VRARLLSLLEGLALLGTGGLLFGLALSGRYWHFLNPRFAPISLATGLALALLAPLAAFRPAGPRPGGLFRLLGFALFLGLAAFAVARAGYVPTAAPARPAAAAGPAEPLVAPEDAAPQTLDPRPAAVPPSRALRDGREYVRLNLAELFLLADQRPKDVPACFVVLGQVRQGRRAKAAGLALLSRVAVVCCLADAVSCCFLADLGQAPEGQWLEVYGRLEPLTDPKLAKSPPPGPEASVSACNERYRIVVEAAEPVAPPEMPYIFEFRDREPFAW
jgi:hypothetical protein